MRTPIRIVALLTAAITLGACSSDDTDSRKSVLSDLESQVIVPAYEIAVTRTQDLVNQVERACSQPSAETTSAVIESVTDTRQAWRMTESVWVGPVMNSRAAAFVDYPVNTADVDKVLANTTLTKIDQDVITNRVGADERGLQAMEYLVTGDLNDARRCDYLKAAAKTIDTEVQKILEAWTTGDGGDDGDGAYRQTFVDDVDMSLDAVINDQINLLHAMGDLDLGAVLGNETRAPNADAVVEVRAGQAIAAEKARLAGIELTLLGEGERTGIAPLLSDTLRSRIGEQTDAASQALDNVDGSLREALANDKADLQAAKDAIDQLRRTVATEVVSHLGVAVGFSDSDGDSSK